MTDNNTALKRAVEMHREFAALNSSLFLDFELVEHLWENVGGDEIRWNTDDNEIDLTERQGETYNIETYRGALYEDEDYLLIEGDNGCGDSHYYLFLKEKEVKNA